MRMLKPESIVGAVLPFDLAFAIAAKSGDLDN